MWEEMAVVTNQERVIGSATFHYTVEHYIEAEKKMDHLAYLMVVAATVSAG